MSIETHTVRLLLGFSLLMLMNQISAFTQRTLCIVFLGFAWWVIFVISDLFFFNFFFLLLLLLFFFFHLHYCLLCRGVILAFNLYPSIEANYGLPQCFSLEVPYQCDLERWLCVIGWAVIALHSFVCWAQRGVTYFIYK